MNLYRIIDCVRRDMYTNLYGLEVRQPHVYMAGSPQMIVLLLRRKIGIRGLLTLTPFEYKNEIRDVVHFSA